MKTKKMNQGSTKSQSNNSSEEEARGDDNDSHISSNENHVVKGLLEHMALMLQVLKIDEHKHEEGNIKEEEEEEKKAENKEPIQVDNDQHTTTTSTTVTTTEAPTTATASNTVQHRQHSRGPYVSFKEESLIGWHRLAIIKVIGCLIASSSSSNKAHQHHDAADLVECFRKLNVLSTILVYIIYP